MSHPIWVNKDTIPIKSERDCDKGSERRCHNIPIRKSNTSLTSKSWIQRLTNRSKRNSQLLLCHLKEKNGGKYCYFALSRMYFWMIVAFTTRDEWTCENSLQRFFYQWATIPLRSLSTYKRMEAEINMTWDFSSYCLYIYIILKCLEKGFV